MGRKRGANRYTVSQKQKFEQILKREQVAPRVPPRARSVGGRDLGIKQAVDRVGPNVISKFFYNKVINQRDKDFWEKPWGIRKVDLPLPSYNRDFKNADTYLLEPHFSHFRRNVGISKNAAASQTMMRSLSAPLTIPGHKPETEIYGCHAVQPPPRLPMIDLPPRTPLENSIAMGDAMSASQPLARPARRKKSMQPEKLNAFIDELTEAYALCSAHEQVKAEIKSMRESALSKDVNLPHIPDAQVEKPIGMLKTILSKSKIRH